MTKVDIFAQTTENVKPDWAKFKVEGDKAQGTYIGKIVGTKDGFGNEQIIYQLLQEDGGILNAGFGLNKKFLHEDMTTVKFGQIIGFVYKGKLTIKSKMTGQDVQVNEFGLHEDSKIVDQVWLDENKDSMPEITVAEPDASEIAAQKEFDGVGEGEEDVPFPNETKEEAKGVVAPPVVEAPVAEAPANLTDDDKLLVIQKLAIDKLKTTDLETSKTKIMEDFKIAFIPLNYDKIIEDLTALK